MGKELPTTPRTILILCVHTMEQEAESGTPPTDNVSSEAETNPSDTLEETHPGDHHNSEIILFNTEKKSDIE